MLIAVEGMDGVGKTTLAKKLSTELGYKYVEDPVRMLLGLSEEDYDNLCYKVWDRKYENASAFMFCFGNIMTRSLGENVVVDRHLLSTYYWDSNEQNSKLFDIATYGQAIPDLTIVLYADIDTRISRIKSRNAEDEDLTEKMVLNEGYEKMLSFADETNIPYVVIDTTNKSIEDVYNESLISVKNAINNANLNTKSKTLKKIMRQ